MNTFDEPLGDKAASAPTQGQANPPNRILLVDDEVSIREISAKVLVRSGYQVDTAEDGEAGWNALHATSYDLLITDHNMPKLSGVELVKKLRSVRMNLPVVLASAALPTEELDQNPWLQLAATLLKPFTVGELLETVKEVLSASTTTASAQSLTSPVLAGAVIPIESLPRWRSQPPSGAAKCLKTNAGTLMQELREQTLSRNIASVMYSDRPNKNGVPGKSGNAGYSRSPRVFSNPTPTVSIRSQKGMVVLIGLALFLSYLWMFNRPN